MPNKRVVELPEIFALNEHIRQNGTVLMHAVQIGDGCLDRATVSNVHPRVE